MYLINRTKVAQLNTFSNTGTLSEYIAVICEKKKSEFERKNSAPNTMSHSMFCIFHPLKLNKTRMTRVKIENLYERVTFNKHGYALMHCTFVLH